jgi:predicted peptidase
LKEDGLAILKFAENHYKIDKNNIYIFGRSLGGAVGAYVASKL